MATITIGTGHSRFWIEGSEEDIKNYANRIATGFRTVNGAWISNGKWTAWVPSSAQVWVNPGAPVESGIDVIMIEGLHREEGDQPDPAR